MTHGDHDELLPRERAVDRVIELRENMLETHATEPVSLEEIAGRTLATDLVSEADYPPVSTATMDGFAFDATDEYPLTLVGSVFPESEPPEIESGEAVHIATGAPLPENATAVLKREDATVDGEELTGPSIDPGTDTYERGSNVSAGETLFRAGERLAPKDAIFLRDLGLERVSVSRKFSAGLLATGTEIHEGTSSDLDSPMLAGLVTSWGHEAKIEGTVPDDADRVEDEIAAIATEHDIVITTGGTSVGTKDHVLEALESLGAISFRGVRLRPGKPIAVATLPAHDAIAVAIPGKPIGAHTAATAILRPFCTGDRSLPTVTATLESDVGIGREGFEYWVPVVLESSSSDTDEAGEQHQSTHYRALPLGHVDSPLEVYDDQFDASVISSSTRASRADGFVVLESGVDTGEQVQVVPYEAIV